jgi:hypothetical protein
LHGIRPFRGDVGERLAHALAHRLRAAHVDVRSGLEEAPDERALRPQPVLHILASLLTRGHDVHVVEHSFIGEPLDLVGVDVVERA